MVERLTAMAAAARVGFKNREELPQRSQKSIDAREWAWAVDESASVGEDGVINHSDGNR
jgi:hypothetical protein